MPPQFPSIPALELAGTVFSSGDEVTGVRVGDRVFGRTRSTYAELCAAKASELVGIPEGLDVARACGASGGAASLSDAADRFARRFFASSEPATHRNRETADRA